MCYRRYHFVIQEKTDKLRPRLQFRNEMRKMLLHCHAF